MRETSFSDAGHDPASHLDFDPAEVRYRHDGWTPARQHDFIQALAESGCVTEACAAVGLSQRSAYRLRAMASANTFRQAWDVALDYAIRRLGDAALGRALHGVSRPIFYKGEQVGERTYYDERLTQFLLRYRDPVRYGRWNDSMEAQRHPDGAGITLARALNAVLDAAHGAEPGEFDDLAPEDLDPVAQAAAEARAFPAARADVPDDEPTAFAPPLHDPPANPLAADPPLTEAQLFFTAMMEARRVELGLDANWQSLPRPKDAEASDEGHRSLPILHRSIRARRRRRGRGSDSGGDVV